MDKYKNKKAELRAWAKDDIVPSDLQWLCRESANLIEKFQAELEKHRWIPVSERLPEMGQEVWITDGSKRVFKSKYQKTYWYGVTFYFEKYITHWKPIILPEQTP